jgi:hypothetical protein
MIPEKPTAKMSRSLWIALFRDVRSETESAILQWLIESVVIDLIAERMNDDAYAEMIGARIATMLNGMDGAE